MPELPREPGTPPVNGSTPAASAFLSIFRFFLGGPPTETEACPKGKTCGLGRMKNERFVNYTSAHGETEMNHNRKEKSEMADRITNEPPERWQQHSTEARAKGSQIT
ncbi:MAG: hypothetical protein R3C28_11290 [Pirellulaceae bacterium]